MYNKSVMSCSVPYLVQLGTVLYMEISVVLSGQRLSGILSTPGCIS